MADENSSGPITAEARREWDLNFEKLKGNLPPVKRASQPVSPTVTVTKQPLTGVRVTPVPKAPVVPVVLRYPVPAEKPIVAPVQQANTQLSLKGDSSMTLKETLKQILKDPVVRILIVLIAGFICLTGIDYLRDKSAEKRNARELADAISEKEVAEVKVSTPSVEKKIPVVPAVASGPVYNCNGPESIQAGFRQRKVHTLREVSGTPITGCMLLSIGNTSDGPVAFSGSNYVIELPVAPLSSSYDDQSSYYSCPTIENPSCSEFFEKARRDPTYQDKAVRVLTMVDSSVTITQTKGE